jgi:hypothetical protein
MRHDCGQHGLRHPRRGMVKPFSCIVSEEQWRWPAFLRRMCSGCRLAHDISKGSKWRVKRYFNVKVVVRITFGGEYRGERRPLHVASSWRRRKSFMKASYDVSLPFVAYCLLMGCSIYLVAPANNYCSFCPVMWFQAILLLIQNRTIASFTLL